MCSYDYEIDYEELLDEISWGLGVLMQLLGGGYRLSEKGA